VPFQETHVTWTGSYSAKSTLLVEVSTDEGIVGISEASLEWQEEATQRVLHEFFEKRYVLGANPFDVESLCHRMVRDQYRAAPSP